MSKNAILFDLDGTLWDASAVVSRVWTETIRANGLPNFLLTAKGIRAQMGKTMNAIGESLMPEVEPSERRRLMDMACEAENRAVWKEGGILYPRLEETLQTLSPLYTLAIVSNCQDGYIEAFLHAHDLAAYFTDIQSGGNDCSKGYNIRLVMERNGIDRAVYIGDTARDQSAAQEARVPFIHASYGFGIAHEPDGVLTSISELPGMIPSFFSA